MEYCLDINWEVYSSPGTVARLDSKSAPVRLDAGVDTYHQPA